MTAGTAQPLQVEVGDTMVLGGDEPDRVVVGLVENPHPAGAAGRTRREITAATAGALALAAALLATGCAYLLVGRCTRRTSTSPTCQCCASPLSPRGFPWLPPPAAGCSPAGNHPCSRAAIE